MKDIYQKPNFRFVALNMDASPSACHYTISSTWAICPVVLENGFTVFADRPTTCRFGPDAPFPICQHNGGANSNVFGS